ncbi:GPI mannosyltransferase [Penicillium argentinense]|uniref:Mannosyltransferase n=1 Tax=Penicillium argentinense TaxID=1131581 RepID=A0A9W9K3K2_9EURO|nr:GPI mannosyltransferase [Penicillium argentinense]KAJ5090857.1 GPI mannosyltransferase [Penicillium argentinense]
MAPSNASARRAASSPAANIFLFLLAFRILNAFTVRTFFQPDEFFQSLEPAWQIAFGKDQGAWVTWEWRHQLRSSIHPLLFAAVYKTADLLATTLQLPSATRAELLIAGPKTAQAVVSAIGDFYTWKLATRIYGKDSRGAWTTRRWEDLARREHRADKGQLLVTILNPWQWFCSTRTLSNCLETTVTIVALDLWPWQWAAGSLSDGSRKDGRGTVEDRALLSSIRKCLLLAALACILRPTNILIWATLASFALLRTSWGNRMILVREVLICGSAVLAVSAVADRLFYGFWTFPPLRFLYFNIAQSLAVFYGRNDWHYYLSQGFPLLLTTALPFALWGLYQTLTFRTFSVSDRLQTETRIQLAVICLVMPFVLSLISHKEVRFIYPLLPSLHILAAPPLVQYFSPVIYYRSSHAYTPQRLLLIFFIFANVVIAFYTSVLHASGSLNILTYLRRQHEVHANGQKASVFSSASTANGITAGFLMPCHSTPWRSHLVYPTIDAWALSCEPPIGLTETEKAVYRDEADQFYDDPAQFLRDNMAGGLRHLPRRPSYVSPPDLAHPESQHPWPDYLIFFEQLEPTLQTLLRGSSYGECWRTYNTAWHDDWRRRGDIIAWCLDTTEQDNWRETQRRSRSTNTREFHLDRMIDAIKNEASRAQPKKGWKAFLPSASFSYPWSPSQPTFAAKFASWRRAVKAYFAPRPSSFWTLGRPAPNIRDLVPRWSSLRSYLPERPAWLGGKSRKKILERELWS